MSSNLVVGLWLLTLDSELAGLERRSLVMSFEKSFGPSAEKHYVAAVGNDKVAWSEHSNCVADYNENCAQPLCWNHEWSSSTCVRADHDVRAILLNKLLNKSSVLLRCGQNEWRTQFWNTAAAQEKYIQTNVDTRQIPRSFRKTKSVSFEYKCEGWKYSS